MFELADRLIGIYKTYDCTKSASLDPKKFCMPTDPIPLSQQPAPLQPVSQQAQEIASAI